MKFYEMREPYYALITAEDEKQCLKLYKDIVCEVEDEKEFFDDMKIIDKYEAFKMLAKSHTVRDFLLKMRRSLLSWKTGMPFRTKS
ncbi:TPA: hypothetical protein ACMUBA_001864 [Enterococcus faecalis]